MCIWGKKIIWIIAIFFIYPLKKWICVHFITRKLKNISKNGFQIWKLQPKRKSPRKKAHTQYRLQAETISPSVPPVLLHHFFNMRVRAPLKLRRELRHENHSRWRGQWEQRSRKCRVRISTIFHDVNCFICSCLFTPPATFDSPDVFMHSDDGLSEYDNDDISNESTTSSDSEITLIPASWRTWWHRGHQIQTQQLDASTAL